jgi:hypothetical protein
MRNGKTEMTGTNQDDLVGWISGGVEWHARIDS